MGELRMVRARSTGSGCDAVFGSGMGKSLGCIGRGGVAGVMEVFVLHVISTLSLECKVLS